MAAVSTYSNGRPFTSHMKSERGGDEWDFNTPVDRNGNPMPSNTYSSKTATSHPRNDNNVTTKTNGALPPPPPTSSARLEEIEQANAEGRITPKSSKSGHNVDPSYLSPFKNGIRPDLSRSGSEPDSLLDLYGHPRSSRSITSRRGDSPDLVESEPAMPGTYTEVEEDPERSRWIHRDKLAVIESQEMQEAGIQISAPKVRPNSRSKARRDAVEDFEVEGSRDLDHEAQPLKEDKRRRITSPVRQQPPDEAEESTLVNDFDIRTPEEIAADSSAIYRQQPELRKSSSRIPLPRSSPMPIPQETIERNTPLPRKRGASVTWPNGDEETLQYSKSRMHSRSNSYGSQNLLDDPDFHHTPTPIARPSSQDENSPSKLRSTSTPTTKQGFPTRKSSLSRPPTSHQNPRSNSSTPRTPSNPVLRPKSRSGLEPRPPTAINRPEGDPPWLATMYKPDPRLPPDQQILPTHAKRLQQEQWEQARKESEARQAQIQREEARDLPRDFSPLAVHTRNGLVAPSSPEKVDKEKQKARESGAAGEWPLAKATTGKRSPERNSPSNPDGISANTNGNGIASGNHAKYSTIPPRLRPQEHEHSVSVEGGIKEKDEPAKRLDLFDEERMARAETAEKGEEEGEEEGKKEKGCGGCCVIM